MKFKAIIALALVAVLASSVSAQEERMTIRVGQQAAGTFSWITHAMVYFGLDEKYNLEILEETYASKPATQLALQTGEVDVVVDDFVGAVQMRDAGVPVRGIWPFSAATGGLVVPVDSDIQSIADLQGRSIGTASLGDKAILILRALLISQYGFDPQADGQVLQAAAPLQQGLLESGELDAALPFWHFVARMEASGEFRDVQHVSEWLTELGFRNDLPILIVVGRDGADPEIIRTFLAAFVETVEMMRADSMDGVWQSILDAELYSLPDPSLFPAVRARWEAGIPPEWTDEMIDELVALVDQLVEAAGPDLVGIESISADAFTTEYNPE